MKWFVLGAISLYRRLPARFKPQCLFRETCSAYVERVTRESGFWLGLLALRTRVSQCRPRYLVYFDNEVESWHVRFANGSVSNSSQLAHFVLAPYTHGPRRPWVSGETSAHMSVEK
jgi:putative component of membrane protein insertase Oxa1/YidC/SpoIIIJ protein YidD